MSIPNPPGVKLPAWGLSGILILFSDIFLVMKEMRSPSYGGLILHYDPMKLIKITEQGEKIVDKVKVRELAERICRKDLTGEFSNDDDDEGDEFFNNVFP